VISGGGKHRIAELMHLRLRFLNAHHIGLLRVQPIEKPFSGSCPDAVSVATDYRSHRILSVQFNSTAV
jgi:hypothetical protein